MRTATRSRGRIWNSTFHLNRSYLNVNNKNINENRSNINNNHSCFAPLRRPYEKCQAKPRFTIRALFIPALFVRTAISRKQNNNFLNALVAKFSYRQGLTPTVLWKWPRATLSSSFGLFLFKVFQVGQSGPFLAGLLDPTGGKHNVYELLHQ